MTNSLAAAAAAFGGSSSARNQRYAAANASPAPVGSAVSTGVAPTKSSRVGRDDERAARAEGQHDLWHIEPSQRSGVGAARKGCRLAFVQLEDRDVTEDARRSRRPSEAARSRHDARGPARRSGACAPDEAIASSALGAKSVRSSAPTWTWRRAAGRGGGVARPTMGRRPRRPPSRARRPRSGTRTQVVTLDGTQRDGHARLLERRQEKLPVGLGAARRSRSLPPRAARARATRTARRRRRRGGAPATTSRHR